MDNWKVLVVEILKNLVMKRGIKIFEISTLGWHRDGCQPRVLAQFD